MVSLIIDLIGFTILFGMILIWFGGFGYIRGSLLYEQIDMKLTFRLYDISPHATPDRIKRGERIALEIRHRRGALKRTKNKEKRKKLKKEIKALWDDFNREWGRSGVLGAKIFLVRSLQKILVLFLAIILFLYLLQQVYSFLEPISFYANLGYLISIILFALGCEKSFNAKDLDDIALVFTIVFTAITILSRFANLRYWQISNDIEILIPHFVFSFAYNLGSLIGVIRESQKW